MNLYSAGASTSEGKKVNFKRFVKYQLTRTSYQLRVQVRVFLRFVCRGRPFAQVLQREWVKAIGYASLAHLQHYYFAIPKNGSVNCLA